MTLTQFWPIASYYHGVLAATELAIVIEAGLRPQAGIHFGSLLEQLDKLSLDNFKTYFY